MKEFTKQDAHLIYTILKSLNAHDEETGDCYEERFASKLDPEVLEYVNSLYFI